MSEHLNSIIDLLTVEIERHDDPRLRRAREQVLDAAGVAVKPRRWTAGMRLAKMALSRNQEGANGTGVESGGLNRLEAGFCASTGMLDGGQECVLDS